MLLLSTQILIINFLVSALITAIVYFFKKSVRHVNPLLLFLVSSLGSFLGSLLAIVLPTFEETLIQSLILLLPGSLLSVLFIFIWARGVKSESYF